MYAELFASEARARRPAQSHIEINIGYCTPSALIKAGRHPQEMQNSLGGGGIQYILNFECVGAISASCGGLPI